MASASLPSVGVCAQIRLLSDPDAEVDECAELPKEKFHVELTCTEGSKFTFADFYRTAMEECLINFHILD